MELWPESFEEKKIFLKPTNSRTSLHFFSHSSMFHMLTFIFPSFLIALSLNIPKWLEFEHITRCHYNSLWWQYTVHSQPGEHHSDPRSSGAERGSGLRHHGAETQSELCLLLHAINPVDRHYCFVMIMHGLFIWGCSAPEWFRLCSLPASTSASSRQSTNRWRLILSTGKPITFTKSPILAFIFQEMRDELALII